MHGITAVIITLNEEDNIARCLESLRGVVDEMLVADTGSSDATCKRASELGARVESLHWEGYAATKNRANALAACDYILSVDADEALSDALKASISAIRSGGLNGAYSFNRLTNYCGHWIRHCGWYPDTKVRLFPKGAAEWKGDHVHEELVCDQAMPTTHLSGDLLHYSYSSVKEHRERAEHYARLGAQKLLGKESTLLGLKTLFAPLLRFLRMYVVQLGFLDGRMGWHVSVNVCREVYLKYRLAWEKRSVEQSH